MTASPIRVDDEDAFGGDFWFSDARIISSALANGDPITLGLLIGTNTTPLRPTFTQPVHALREAEQHRQFSVNSEAATARAAANYRVATLRAKIEAEANQQSAAAKQRREAVMMQRQADREAANARVQVEAMRCEAERVKKDNAEWTEREAIRISKALVEMVSVEALRVVVACDHHDAKEARRTRGRPPRPAEGTQPVRFRRRSMGSASVFDEPEVVHHALGLADPSVR